MRVCVWVGEYGGMCVRVNALTGSGALGLEMGSESVTKGRWGAW